MIRYRLLSAGEPIQPGDEGLQDDCKTWLPLSGWEVGMAYNPIILVPVRRQLDMDEPQIELGDEVARLRAVLRTIVSRADDAKARCDQGKEVCAYNLASGILGQIGTDAVMLRNEGAS